MPYCAVPCCTNGSSSKSDGIKWFSFPKEKLRAQEWWQCIKRDGSVCDVKDLRVCSVHFDQPDYVRDLKFELLHPGVSLPVSKLRLTDTAYPTKNIPESHPTREHSAHVVSLERLEKKARREILNDVLRTPEEQGCASCRELQTRITTLQEEVNTLKQKLAAQEAAQASPVAEQASSGMFSKQQMAVLLTRQRPRQWDQESAAIAVNIRVNTSRRVYAWLRGEGLPLPSLTSLQRWLAEFRLEPNSTAVTEGLLKMLLRDMPTRDRYCNLMVDEMNLTKALCHDQQRDQ